MAGEWGDLLSFDFQPQMDLGDYASGLGGGAYTGGAMQPAPAGGYGGLEVGLGENGGDWNGYSGGEPGGYNGSADILSSRGMYDGMGGNQNGWVSNPSAPYSANQSFGMDTPNFGPTAGRPTGSTGSQQAGSQEDDWKKMLMKAGIGLGGSVLSTGIGAGINALTQPKPQKSQPLPQMSSAIPTAAPLQPLPGTQASPLISGGPTQTNLSAGLQDPRRKPMGGLFVS